MKKSIWIVFCLAAIFAALFGQQTAWATNWVYNVTSVDHWSAAGLGHVNSSSLVTVTFSDDGTFDLDNSPNGEHWYDQHFTGTWAWVDNYKQISLTFDDNGLAALSNNVADVAQDIAFNLGKTLDDTDLSVSIKSYKLGNIVLKHGAFYKESGKTTGKISAQIINGRYIYNKGFTHTWTLKDWVLVETNP